MKIINSKDAPQAIGPYSQAILTNNNMLFISGQIPMDLSGNIPETIEEQTKQVLRNIHAILVESNFTVDNIVKTTIFLSDMSNFTKVNAIYATFFKDKFPARSTVEVSKLPKDVMVEIETIAIK